MGRSEKLMVIGFVALTAGVAVLGPIYTMQEGYATKARKQLERSNNQTQQKGKSDKDSTPARKAPTTGGVWGNMAKRRDAIAATKK